MTARHRTSWAAGVVGVLLISVSACSDDPAAPEGPWADEYKSAQSRLTSDFEKEVFSDGEISREEYTEAVNLWVTCMTDLGMTASVEPEADGFFTYTVRSVDGNVDQQSDQCRVGTVDEIEPLYVDSTKNPKNITLPEAMRDCLVAADRLDASFTSIEMETEIDALFEGTSSKFDSTDPSVAECVSNPFGTRTTQ